MSTFIVHHSSSFISRYIDSQAHFLSIPVNLKRVLEESRSKKDNQVNDELLQSLEKMIKEKGLLNLSTEEGSYAIPLLALGITGDYDKLDNFDNLGLDFTLTDEDFDFPDKEITRKQDRETIDEILKSLNEREKDIIVKRFGLYGDEELTLEEIGTEYKVTRERIRQIEKKALEKLKNATSISL